MKDFISVLSDSFSRFLSEITVQNKESISGSLISFAVELSDFNLNDKIDTLLNSASDYFYFSSPDDQVMLTGLEKVYSITESGQGRFAATDKKLKEISARFISNWKGKNLPVFTGAVKFMVEHSDDVWKDFDDSDWFIPEVIFYKNKDKTYILYNYYAEQAVSKARLLERFINRIEKLLGESAGFSGGLTSKIINKSGSSPKDKKKWKQAVNKALEQINSGEVKKIVLARKIEIIISDEVHIPSALRSLVKDYSNCYIFAYHSGKSTFFGATPELLIKMFNKRIEVDAIAGSVERGETEEDDARLGKELLLNTKNLIEHQYVLEQLKEGLSKMGEKVTYSANPSVKKLKNIQHLETRITAEMKDETSIMALLKELHPTPAVCGFPKDTAQNLIKKLENYRRGLYSGIVGWFNLDSNGEFAVAIRSAVTTANRVTAFAGSGIVEGSDPDSEFDETEIKFKPILSLFNEKN